MVYRLAAQQAKRTVAATPKQLCELMGGMANGVKVPPPKGYGFGLLGPSEPKHTLGAGSGFFLHARSETAVVRAIGLYVGASVVYYNDRQDAYVYHAQGGNVTYDSFQRVLDLMGELRKLWIVYAHPYISGKWFEHAPYNFVYWGVNINQIVEIVDLPVGQFGISSTGQLGY